MVTIEKKGKPYAVIMSPEELERYKTVAKKAYLATVVNIRAKNANVNTDEVMKDVTKAVEKLRQEMYERGK